MTRDYYGTKRVTAWSQEKDGKPGYAVKYADGYISWSPKDVFEAAYQPLDGLSFGHALEVLKAGGRVARAGWNGKGMWICLGKGQHLEPNAFWNKHTREFAKGVQERAESVGNEGFTEVLPYFILKTADDKILMGWLASQTDMLAEDWAAVE